MALGNSLSVVRFLCSRFTRPLVANSPIRQAGTGGTLSIASGGVWVGSVMNSTHVGKC